MKKHLALLLLPLALSACGSVRETLGMDAQSGPDEFDVATAPPLSIPPDFNLRPPEPGAPRPQAVNPQTTARELLTGSAEEPAGSEHQSEGETMLSVPTTLVETGGTLAAPASVTASNAEDNLLAGVGTRTPVDAAVDDNARLQNILEAPVTRNESGKLPQIEMQDTGSSWDSWF